MNPMNPKQRQQDANANSNGEAAASAAAASSSIFQSTPIQPLTVKIFNIKEKISTTVSVINRFRACQIYDGEFIIDGMLYVASGAGNMSGSNTSTSTNSNATRNCIIKVTGYVTSESNTPTVPFICITSFEYLSGLGNSNAIIQSYPSPPSIKIAGGRAGSLFFQETVACFTDEELVGLSTSGAFGTELNRSFIQDVSSFLVNYQAMKTLSQIPNDDKSVNYMKAINEFSDSQMQRQIASLSSNAGREDADRSAKLVNNYSSALSMALAHGRDPHRNLDVDVLCAWHRELGGDGLIENAGCIRKKQVRAGPTTFTHKDHVVSELEHFLMGMRELENRLVHNNRGGVLDSNKGYGPIAFAAAALFGVNDIHPFNDGNGRMSRILANWALARAGHAFVTNFFATPQQRTEYVHALQMTRINTTLVSRGAVSPDVFSVSSFFILIR